MCSHYTLMPLKRARSLERLDIRVPGRYTNSLKRGGTIKIPLFPFRTYKMCSGEEWILLWGLTLKECWDWDTYKCTDMNDKTFDL